MVVFVVTAVPTAAAATAAIANTTANTAVFATAAATAAVAMDGRLLPDLCVCAAEHGRRSPHTHKEPKEYWELPERSFQDELLFLN